MLLEQTVFDFPRFTSSEPGQTPRLRSTEIPPDRGVSEAALNGDPSGTRHQVLTSPIWGANCDEDPHQSWPRIEGSQLRVLEYAVY